MTRRHQSQQTQEARTNNMVKSAEMPSVSSLTTSTSSVQIGDGSYSPGDLYLECILPKVVSKRSTPSTAASSSPSSKSKSSKFSKASTSTESPVSLSLSSAEVETEVVPFAQHPSILQAQAECRSLQNGNDVQLLEDEDVKEEVVQILGPEAQLTFPCRNIFRYLVLFVKNMEQFFEFQVDVLDHQQEYRVLKATNARSLARVDRHTCQLPILFGERESWRYLCVDLQDVVMRAFGTKHVATTRICIGGNCRLLRMFFQDEMYLDTELPSHLTFLG